MPIGMIQRSSQNPTYYIHTSDLLAQVGDLMVYLDHALHEGQFAWITTWISLDHDGSEALAG